MLTFDQPFCPIRWFDAEYLCKPIQVWTKFVSDEPQFTVCDSFFILLSTSSVCLLQFAPYLYLYKYFLHVLDFNFFLSFFHFTQFIWFVSLSLWLCVCQSLICICDYKWKWEAQGKRKKKMEMIHMLYDTDSESGMIFCLLHSHTATITVTYRTHHLIDVDKTKPRTERHIE